MESGKSTARTARSVDNNNVASWWEDTSGNGFTCDVLVVGAGLAGLATALQLSRDQVRVALVDAHPSEEAKRSAFQGGGTLLTPTNVLWARRMGLYKSLSGDPSSSREPDFEALSSPALITNGKVQQGVAASSGANSNSLGWLKAEVEGRKNYAGDEFAYLSLSQSFIEDQILERIRSSRFVKVLWNHAFEGLAGDGEAGGATALVSSPTASMQVRCKYVVGCDGRSSKVRETCFNGDRIEGYEWKEHKGVMLHMMCECQVKWGLERKSYRLEQKSLNGFGPTIGGGAAMPVPGSDNSLYRLSVNAPFTMWGSNMECMEPPPLSLLQKQLKPKLPKGTELADPKWSRYYRMNHFISSAFWASGRVFLVGEAAHAHPPVGILPMNAALEDADNLSWKLSMAVKLGLREGEDGVLASYEEERKPRAEAVRKSIAGYFSDLMQGKLSPIRYAHNDCGLFATYPESRLIVRSNREQKYLVKAGEIAPNVRELFLTNTMKKTTLGEILTSSNKHKIFCFCSDWPVKMDSPYNDSEPSHSGMSFSLGESAEKENCGEKAVKSPRPSVEKMTWDKIQHSVEFMLGKEFVLQCEFYILHTTSKIAHMDGLDYQLIRDPVHVVDAKSQFMLEYFGSDDCLAGVMVRPDMRVGAIGEFPDFLEDLGHYHHQSGVGPAPVHEKK
ncbi:flavoprotein monooxygenase [Chloropicon primus]|uniref:Flavoprotein monooxygenase n=1 Tax=Chloropicon primus TaxID=1764295 RepID=A0A5B8MGI5_9CHLO|nr:flavoprotein monooxygenase [Chloropicon primus]UPQ98718.1 flavoprotein monooxygenase [Chloropicon primus]|mmetsp:Transcript_336/g.911  ORF Transcript_336/g.911 Transcript_336/m.911 type:complete len:673 (-) Transcript_336:2823-4841(-)|eukprot:QDZ19507.1 flavoprotein monooxygenase [Chloropicon primus]